jgi:hypothetical protein
VAWETLAESVEGAAATGAGFVGESNGLMTITDPADDEPERFYRVRATVELGE